jgi:hypothetical protein
MELRQVDGRPVERQSDLPQPLAIVCQEVRGAADVEALLEQPGDDRLHPLLGFFVE